MRDREEQVRTKEEEWGKESWSKRGIDYPMLSNFVVISSLRSVMIFYYDFNYVIWLSSLDRYICNLITLMISTVAFYGSEFTTLYSVCNYVYMQPKFTYVILTPVWFWVTFFIADTCIYMQSEFPYVMLILLCLLCSGCKYIYIYNLNYGTVILLWLWNFDFMFVITWLYVYAIWICP